MSADRFDGLMREIGEADQRLVALTDVVRRCGLKKGRDRLVALQEETGGLMRELQRILAAGAAHPEELEGIRDRFHGVIDRWTLLLNIPEAVA